MSKNPQSKNPQSKSLRSKNTQSKDTLSKSSLSKNLQPKNFRSTPMIRKENKQNAKRAGWASKISQISIDRKLEDQSKKAPLKHFELMQTSLANIKEELKTKKTASKADQNRNNVTSARGRAHALSKERAQFSKVMRHPAFQRDPIAELQEAERLLAEAEQCGKPRKILFFSSSPDYMEASNLYNRAGNAFKSCKEWRSAGDAFRKAADMDVAGGEIDESARKLLNAASCYKKCDPAEAVATIQSALEVLLRSGRFHLAAAHEKEIAEIYETQLDDPKNSMLYYERAAERYAGEDSTSMAQSCKLKAATLAALSGQYEHAAMIFEEAASESVNDQLRKYSVRDFLLKGGICRLCGGDRIASRRCLDGYPMIDASFSSSREYKLLTDIVDALEAEDLDAFTEAVSTFDKTSALDDWKTKMLLRIKNNFSAEPDLT